MQGMVIEIEVRGMDHHRRVHAFEGAGARHDLLAAKSLFRRRAEIAHAARKLRAEFRQRHRRAEACGRDDVMPTGMADAGQRVVFGENRDHRSAVLAEFRGIGGLHAEGFALNRQIHALATASDSRACRLEFLEREFRLGVDGVTELEKLRAHAVDSGGNVFFQSFNIHRKFSRDRKAS